MIIKREKPKSFLPIHITITNAQEEAFLKYIFKRALIASSPKPIDLGAKEWAEDVVHQMINLIDEESE